MALLMFQSRLNRFAEFELRRRLDEWAGDPLKDRPGFRVIESLCDKPSVRRFDRKGLDFLPFLEVRKPLGALVKEDFRHHFAAESARKLREAAEQAEAGKVVQERDLKPRAGTRGRAVTMRKFRFPTITDLDALLAHYANDPRFKGDKGVKDALQALGKTDTEAGDIVPGFEMKLDEVPV